MPSDAVFDYVIVGAGSAGCALAYRLSEDPAHRVLLLEAGGRDSHPFIHMPAAFTYNIDRDQFDWRYVAEKEPGIDGRDMPCPRGFVLGGSSSINAMAFGRGHSEDFDGWAANGLPEWSYAHCLPYFKRMETFSGLPSPYRGKDGPLHVTQPVYTSPLNEIFLEAVKQAGFPLSDDTNGRDEHGVGPADQTIHKGSRESTARAYLRPIRNRKNLTVRTGCLAAGIRFEGKRAVGLDYVQNGQAHFARAEREVIVAAGAVGSPQLLMLSGVGPAGHLKSLGIDVRHDLPGVGQNLHDHYDIRMKQHCLKPVTMNWALKWYWKPSIFFQWLLFKKGPAATNHFEVLGHIRTRPELVHPDVQISFAPLMANTDGSAVIHGHGFQGHIVNVRPKSRGQLTLRSKDPRDYPHLRVNYLQDPADLVPLREGLRRMREIFAQKAFDGLRGDELAPGPDCRTDAQIDAFTRATGKSSHHLCGTCKMGTDPMAVVDTNGRVHGLDGLRVADSSIFPVVPSIHTNASAIMVGEKLADAALGKPTLPPEHPLQ